MRKGKNTFYAVTGYLTHHRRHGMKAHAFRTFQKGSYIFKRDSRIQPVRYSLITVQNHRHSVVQPQQTVRRVHGEDGITVQVLLKGSDVKQPAHGEQAGSVPLSAFHEHLRIFDVVPEPFGHRDAWRLLKVDEIRLPAAVTCLYPLEEPLRKHDATLIAGDGRPEAALQMAFFHSAVGGVGDEVLRVRPEPGGH